MFKRILSALLILSIPLIALAADTKISAYPSMGALGGTEIFLGNQSGTTKTGTAAQIATYVSANLSGTPALPNGTTATTQAAGDATTKVATDAFIQQNNSVNLFNWGLSVVMPPSGFFANNGVYVVGQAPSSSATLSVSATSGSITATFSAATLLGTASDVGRIITILDTTYKYCTITAQSSTTVATCTESGGALSGTGPFANANLWLTGFPVSNSTAFSIPLPVVFANAYFSFPVNVISASTPAGVYYTTCASTTVCTVFNNALASGKPTIPGSPTSFSTTGTGAFSQLTSAVTILTLSIPANSMGTQGSLVADIATLRPNSTDTVATRMLYAGNNFMTCSAASILWNMCHRTLRNWGATNLQVFLSSGATVSTDTTSNVNAQVTSAVDSTQAQNLTVTGQLTTSALDYLIVVGGTIAGNYSP